MDDSKIRDDVKLKAKNDKKALIILVLIFALLIAAFSVIAVRFYNLQSGRDDARFERRATHQSSGKVTLGAGGEAKLDGHRGYIYDRHGFELAISTETPSIFAHPRRIPAESKQEYSRLLAEALNLDIAEVREKLEKDTAFVWITRKTTPEKGDAVKKLKLAEIGIKRESKRFYPGQEIAGQIIGFAGVDNVGLEGIEAAYDAQLRGDVIKLNGLKDSRGRVLLTIDSSQLNKLEGSSIVLTLDQYIQNVTETALARAAQQFNADAALAIVMDPHTGEVLAMANYPSFNPNRFKDYPKEATRNRVVLDAYEPGSMMKVYTYAAWVDTTHGSPNTPIDQAHGALKIGKHTIHDTHTIPNMTAETVVSESSNVGAYRLAAKIGRDKFYQYLKAFGFGSRTGINIAGESAGILFKPSRWSEIQFSNIAFGHGISVSPIQLATALSAIANGGKKMKPWIISEISDHDGNIIEKGAPVVRDTIISESTARQVRQAMERVITEGTAMKGYVPGYRVGGKTGTAQKIDPRTHLYSNKYMANFEGIAPIDDPNIVVVVMVDHPHPIHAGGSVAAPIFAEIASQVLPYRGVFPKAVMTGKIDPFEIMRQNNFGIASADSLTAENIAFTEPGAANLIADAWPEDRCNQKVTMPELRGLSGYKAMYVAASKCLDVEINEHGFVTSQWPTAGTVVEPHTRVKLQMQGHFKNMN